MNINYSVILFRYVNHLRLFAITTMCSMKCATTCSIKWLPVFTELPKCVEHIHNWVYEKF